MRFPVFHNTLLIMLGKIQNWADVTPTFREVDGDIGLFVGNSASQAYEVHQSTEFQQALTGLDQPTATIIGALGVEAETNIIYPPMYWASANQFALPDPQDSSLSTDFDGAQYYLKIMYQDGSEDYALINQETVTGTDISLFSLNIDLRREPQSLALYHSEAGYPNIDYSTASELYSRTLNLPTELEEVVLSGKGALANGKLRLTDRCEVGVNAIREWLKVFGEMALKRSILQHQEKT